MLKRIVHVFIALGVFLCGAGCGASFDTSTPVGGGSPSPEIAVTSFFDDLNTALDDANLSTAEKQAEWKNRLAGYFPPDERLAIEAEISEALSQFAYDRDQLDANQKLTIDLEVIIVSAQQQENQALVTVKDVGSSLVIGEWSQPFQVPDIIGTSGVIPVVRVQNRWFLSEGWLGWDQELQPAPPTP